VEEARLGGEAPRATDSLTGVEGVRQGPGTGDTFPRGGLVPLRTSWGLKTVVSHDALDGSNGVRESRQMGDHPASVFGEYAWAFWTFPLGTFVVTMAFSFPTECTAGSEALSLKCTNIFGSEAVTISQETATGFGVLIGGGTFLLCWLIASLASNRR
jgi:hypothetical protein